MEARFYIHANNKVLKKVDFSIKVNSFLCYRKKLLFASEDGAYEFNHSNLIPSRRVGNVTIPDIVVPSQPKYLNQTNKFSIKSITENPLNNSIWFCTQGFGLFCLKDDSLTKCSTKNGLPTDIINNVSFTEDGSALLSTNKGLYKSKLINTESRIFKNWQKLYTGEIENALSFEGKIYGLTKSKLFSIENDEQNKIKKPIFFNLNSITEGNSLLQLDKNNFYTINTKPIEFTFDIVCFESERPDLHYQLLGDQIDSGVVATDKIKFNQLEPGQYTLTAYPKINDYKANEIKLIFTVLPSFQQTWKFKMMIGTIILGCLVTIVQFILKRQKRKQTESARNKQLIEEYKLIALKAQINPHFMSNCLSAIQNLVRRNQTEKATVYIAKFGYLVRRILDYSTKHLITLAEELNLTETYLELESLRFENKFKYEIRLSDNIDAKNYLIPPLLLNPIVENALWHGLLPIQSIREPFLLLEVKIIENQLRIIVKDNGVGIKSIINNNENRVSRGLSLVSSPI
jgi:sensor histidine kinase YesM